MTNVCLQWEGLDIDIEDHSACVHCGELWERHQEKLEQAYVMSVVGHPEATLTITHFPEKRVRFP